MAGWRKYFTPVDVDNKSRSISTASLSGRPGPARANYSSYLPDVYAGSPNRVDRYIQYDTMDMDSEVNAALDIITEFCTQKDKENGTPFHTYFKGTPTATEVKLIKESLQKWTKLQQFENRIFKIVRNTFKYGDCFFLRDPQTKKWLFTDAAKVTKVIVNESTGKTPEQYVIRDINFNFKDLVATTQQTTTNISPSGTSSYVSGGSLGKSMVGSASQGTGTRFSTQGNEISVDASHVVHISLGEGLGQNYPFGDSLLESVFKVYKQKELLEDAIIIYRIQRAPERRIFYVDVGNMPAHLAMSFVERVKNEIQQRRIPSSTGGSQSMVDASYNPLCLDLSTRIPLLDGRILELRDLIDEFENGKENWAYSCEPTTGKIVPGVINWAGVTRRNTTVIKITLDNGEFFICTPDHKIPVFGKGFVEARLLTDQDMLIAFTTRTSTTPSDLSKYERVWDHEIGEWVWTHYMVGDFFQKQSRHLESVVLEENIDESNPMLHHRDLNCANNDPKNLTCVNPQGQISYHSAFSTVDQQLVSSDINRKVVNIEIVANRDVGTITIDGFEKWHGFHTFAIESGIFVKNSVNEDYFFPQTAEGRGSKVETLPGGTNLGEITDLRYFTNKLFRALRIPSAYLPTAVDEAPNALSDGKVGTAYIQELRFNEYCKRLQNMVVETFDLEFKIWLESNGVNIDPGLFELKFNPPQNFAAYRQAELDTQRVALFAQLQEIPYLSKRFSMKRFLGMSEEEIKENEKMWREENGDKLKTPSADGSELRGVGVSLGGLGAEVSGQTEDAPSDLASEAGAEDASADQSANPTGK